MKLFKSFSLVLILLSFSLLISGCVFVLGGALGALGGYAVSKDTIQGEADLAFKDVWRASKDVLGEMGAIESLDESIGLIEAKIRSSKVKVKIDQLTPTAIRLKVTARRYLLPNIGLSQNIYIKIMQKAQD